MCIHLILHVKAVEDREREKQQNATMLLYITISHNIQVTRDCTIRYVYPP